MADEERDQKRSDGEERSLGGPPPVTTGHPGPGWPDQRYFFGKYRGLVKDNKDPDGLGRIQVQVPAVAGVQEAWALPATPYAGDQVGFYTIPPAGALVWVEFEGGHPDFPIWTGCFWKTGQVPPEVKTNADDPSQVKVFKTRVLTMWVDDTDQKGQSVVVFNDSTVSSSLTITVTMKPEILEITCAGSKGTTKITADDQDIKTESINLSTKTTKNTDLKATEKMTLDADGDMTLKTAAGLTETATKDIAMSGANVKGTAQQKVEMTGSTGAVLSTSATAEVKGSMVNITGSGPVAVKGNPVQLN